METGRHRLHDAGDPAVVAAAPRAFIVRIDVALVGMKAASLDSLLKRNVFGYSGSPLRDLHVTMAGHQMRLEGIMRKGIEIPFAMLADVAATSDGRIRLHPTKVEICGINGLALLGALGTADMLVADTDPADSFDFSIEQYNDQLVQGFSRNQPNYGLVVYMRDFADVGLPCRPGEKGFCQ